MSFNGMVAINRVWSLVSNFDLFLLFTIIIFSISILQTGLYRNYLLFVLVESTIYVGRLECSQNISKIK